MKTLVLKRNKLPHEAVRVGVDFASDSWVALPPGVAVPAHPPGALYQYTE